MKQTNHKRANTVYFHLSEVFRIVKFIDTVVIKLGGRRELEVIVYEASVWEDKIILDMDGSDGCITV